MVGIGVRFLRSSREAEYTERTFPRKKNGAAVPGAGAGLTQQSALRDPYGGRTALAQPIADLAEQGLVLVADPVQVVDVLGWQG